MTHSNHFHYFNCACGSPACSEPWGPDCDFGRSEAHVWVLPNSAPVTSQSDTNEVDIEDIISEIEQRNAEGTYILLREAEYDALVEAARANTKDNSKKLVYCSCFNARLRNECPRKHICNHQ